MDRSIVASLLIGMFCLLGCANQTSPAKLHVSTPKHKISAPQPILLPVSNLQLVPVINEQSIFALTPEQEQEFLAYYHSERNAKFAGHIRVYDYIADFLLGFHYRGETLSASESLAVKSGNCMSLAVLTKALATLVNVEVEFQLVDSAPIYKRENGVLTMSSHVIAHIYDPDFVAPDSVFVFARPKIIVDYFPSTRGMKGSDVNYSDFIAMFYQNLASEAINVGEVNVTYSLLLQALSHSAFNTETLNTLAVLYRRAGYTDIAEYVYQYIIEDTKGSINSLRNYHRLLLSQGRYNEAVELTKQYELAEDNNPYRWLDLAYEEYDEGEYNQAIRYFRKAENIAPYLHEVQFGLARVFFDSGRRIAAEKSLERAIELSYIDEDKQLYQAKLSVLVPAQSSE